MPSAILSGSNQAARLSSGPASKRHATGGRRAEHAEGLRLVAYPFVAGPLVAGLMLAGQSVTGASAVAADDAAKRYEQAVERM